MGELDNQETGFDTEQEKPTEQPVAPEQNNQAPDSKEQPKRSAGKLDGLKRVLKSKKFRIIAPIIFVSLLLLFLLVEPVKFAALNLFIKGKADFIVVDDATLVPVDGAKITIAGKTGQTNNEGKVTISKVRFGNNDYTIEKENYTTIRDKAKIKPGTNVVGPVKFHSEGTPVQIKATNKLSGSAVSKFKVTIEGSQISALSNDQGLAVLKVPNEKLGALSLVISADGYNDTKTKTKVESDHQLAVTLTPAGKHYFLSNRNGKVGVFSTNLDGTEQVEIIPGKGTDDENTALSISPDGKRGALISKRDELKGADGKVLTALYALDIEQKTIKRIDEGAPYFALLGWQDNSRIIYRISYQEYSRADNSKVKRANISNATLETLHTQKGDADYLYFEDDKKHVYFQNYDATVELYGFIGLDLDTKKTTRFSNVSPSYGYRKLKPSQLYFTAEAQWYELNMKTQTTKTVSSAPASKHLRFSASPDGQKQAWIEDRDGKGSIIQGDSNGENAKQITKTARVNQILRWHSSDYVIFNTQTSDESADYIVHMQTGTVTKLADVYRLRISEGY